MQAWPLTLICQASAPGKEHRVIRSLIFCWVVCSSFMLGSDWQHFQVGKRPDMSNLGFIDQHAKACVIGDLKGKIVVVNFWTAWSPWSIKSLSELIALRKSGNRNGSIVFIACNLDGKNGKDWQQNVNEFLNKNQDRLSGFIYHRPLIGKNGIATNLGADIDIFPTTLLIDREGRLAAEWRGYTPGLIAKEIDLLDRPQQARPEAEHFEFTQLRIKTRPSNPRLPRVERLAGTEGKVDVELTINPEGIPTSATMIEGPPELASLVEEWGLRWRFIAPVLDGKPQRSKLKIGFQFKYKK